MNHTITTALSAITFFIALGCGFKASAVTTASDGDWSSQYVALTNSPEAALMVRVGDIDNLDFGWPSGFDVFSGNSTPAHGFPWTSNAGSALGTDRIMVVTSYVGNPPAGSDGYTVTTSRPANAVTPIILNYSLNGLTVQNATLQIFVDDFQASVFNASYQVTINNRRAPFLEVIINGLNQTGPIGKLLTVQIPSEFLTDVASGRLELRFDDTTTGAGDGYAIDFVKLLVNRTGNGQFGNVSGRITDSTSGAPLQGAVVTAYTSQAISSSTGDYTLTNVPAGSASVRAIAAGRSSQSQQVDVISGETSSNVNFALSLSQLNLSIAPAVELRFNTVTNGLYEVQFSPDLNVWTHEESIVGTGDYVSTFRLVTENRRFWRIQEK